MQEEQRRRERRRSLMVRWGVVIGVVAVVAVVVGVIFANTSRSIPGSGPAPTAANEQGGITLTSATELAEGNAPETVDAEAVGDPQPSGETPEMVPGAEPAPEGEPANVVIYADANCVYCAEFEQANSGQLTEWLENGDITLEYRMVNFLDSPANNNYSSRAADAMSCVAEESPESYKSFITEVFAAYDGEGMSDDELIEMASAQGADIGACVEDNTYRPFVDYTSALAFENDVAGTPTVFVQGQNMALAEGAAENFVEWAQGLIDEHQGGGEG